VSHGEYADGTDRQNGQTDGRQIVTLRFLLNTASVLRPAKQTKCACGFSEYVNAQWLIELAVRNAYMCSVDLPDKDNLYFGGCPYEGEKEGRL